jgi:hypothetical protein
MVPDFEDQCIECTALDEVEYSSPEDWPPWTLDRWTITEPVPGASCYDEWLTRVSEIMDGDDTAGRLDDCDIETATGCAG